jgi:hypothetical protein|tara:strand:+ start:530 stop:739 length:210 start_codon:yes stop_codon:yes gene_type:complete
MAPSSDRDDELDISSRGAAEAVFFVEGALEDGFLEVGVLEVVFLLEDCLADDGLTGFDAVVFNDGISAG